MVSTRPYDQYVSSRSFMKIMAMVKRRSKVYIHTSYLPCLPYETNTYVLFDSVDMAFDTIHEMYIKYAAWTMEARKVATAREIIQRQCRCEAYSLSNIALLADLFQEVSVS